MKFSFENAKLAILFLLIMQVFPACSSKKKSSDTTTSKVDTDCATLDTPALLTLTEEANPFLDYAENLIRDVVPDSIQIHMDKSSYIHRGGAQHVSVNFTLSGIPLCQFQARVHSLTDKTYINGKLPKDLSTTDLPQTFEYKDSDTQRVLTFLGLQGNAEALTKTPCLTWDGQALFSAWELVFQKNTLPYYALITQDKILRAEGRFFDLLNATTVTEESKIYIKNPVTSTNIEVATKTLSGMSPGGSLCSAMFKTVVPDTSLQAFATNKQFFFNTNDIKFKETSFFTNTSIHADWFLSFGILQAWPGPKIDLYMDGTNNYVNNSSVYIPGTSKTSPTIKVGGGNGVLLKNLYIDHDVAAHELGHHVVYQHMTKTSGESLVLHEGLADYFVYGETKYPCLGNLICPSGSTLCYSEQCLRTGEFPMKYGDSDLPTDAHKISQLISSMLWDIGNGNTSTGITGIGIDVATKDALKAIDFLSSDAGYTDFISALMKADKSLDFSNCSTIEKAAKARGFTDIMASANVSCASVQ